MLRFKITILLLAFITLNATAKVEMPAIFGNNMILQQQSDVAFWGKASKGATVKIQPSWSKQSYTAKADADGKWKVKVQTPAAGGPYEVTVTDGSKLTFKNVLIGEVWICSGQSNMDMPLKGYKGQPVLSSNEAIAKANISNIRLFTVGAKGSITPLDTCKGEWAESTSETASEFSAAAYFFGLMLYESLHVPVGLVDVSLGGSKIEAWMSAESLSGFEDANIPQSQADVKSLHNTSVGLFNGMINPIVGYGIKGAIWYQGESNKDKHKVYESLFSAMVSDWRSRWQVGEFPVYFAQLAPFDYSNRPGHNSAYIRSVQLSCMKNVPNTGMAVLLDAGNQWFIHAPNKEVVGNRLAYWALAKTYGLKGLAYSGPVYKAMEVCGNAVTLTFDYAENGLTSFGKELVNFEVAGADKRFYPAKAILSRESVTVVSEFVKEPLAVRYGFKDFVVGDLYNTEGLPASSFRTDDW